MYGYQGFTPQGASCQLGCGTRGDANHREAKVWQTLRSPGIAASWEVYIYTLLAPLGCGHLVLMRTQFDC